MITKKYKAGDINIIAGKGGGDPLTRVDALPEPSEETYNENKIYDQNNNLSYIGRETPEGLDKIDMPGNWNTLSSTPFSYWSFVFIIGDYIYIIPMTKQSNIWRFSLITGDYEEIQNSKYPEEYGSAEDINPVPCPKNNCIYFFGNYNRTTKIYKYDISSNSYSKVSNVSDNSYKWLGINVDNIIYLYPKNQYDIYTFNIETNEFKDFTYRPSSYTTHLMCKDNIIYEFDSYGSVRTYNISTNTEAAFGSCGFDTPQACGFGLLNGNPIFINPNTMLGTEADGEIKEFNLETKTGKVIGNTKLMVAQAKSYYCVQPMNYNNKIYNIRICPEEKAKQFYYLGSAQPIYKSIPVGPKMLEIEGTKVDSYTWEFKFPENTQMIMIKNTHKEKYNNYFYDYIFSSMIPVNEKTINEVAESVSSSVNGSRMLLGYISGTASPNYYDQFVTITNLTHTSIKIKVYSSYASNYKYISIIVLCF